MNGKTTCQYHPEPGYILIKVLRVEDSAILGLGEVVEDAGLAPYSAGTRVLYRGGMAVSEDHLFRILTGGEIVATVEGA